MKINAVMGSVALVASLMLCAAARGDEPLPELTPLAPPAENQLRVFPAPDGKSEPMLQMSAKIIETRRLLDLIGQQMKLKMLVGNKVQGSVNVQSRPMPFTSFMNTLGAAANFNWDRLGDDTILVVPREPEPIRIFERFAPLPRRAPNAPPPPLWPPQPKPDWKPFPFNDNTYYFVPLQQQAAPVAPR